MDEERKRSVSCSPIRSFCEVKGCKFTYPPLLWIHSRGFHVRCGARRSKPKRSQTNAAPQEHQLSTTTNLTSFHTPTSIPITGLRNILRLWLLQSNRLYQRIFNLHPRDQRYILEEPHRLKERNDRNHVYIFHIQWAHHYSGTRVGSRNQKEGAFPVQVEPLSRVTLCIVVWVWRYPCRTICSLPSVWPL